MLTNYMARYYFDTSIWLDFLEDRNQPNMPKSEWAKAFVKNIVAEENFIVYSDAITEELTDMGYTIIDFEELIYPIRQILYAVDYSMKQYGKAKDLCKKRSVPLFDALHALIARDHRAILVSRDAHFRELRDIVVCKKPEDLI